MNKLTRRDFLKTSILGAGLLVTTPWKHWGRMVDEWPDAEKLGRNCTGGMVYLRTKPSPDAQMITPLYEDSVVVWLREVIGSAPAGLYNRKWVETPDGYIYSSGIQPVRNLPNSGLAELPTYGATPGMWVEVTVPYVDLILANPPARSPWLQAIAKPRAYYSQVFWVDGIIQNNEGKTLYQVNDRYGTYGDIYLASAEAFRPITEEEVAPISPDVTDKRINVDVAHQTLTCYEGNQEVYFCRVSTGAKYNAAGEAVDKWSTPIGPHPIWRKSLSIHMAGGGIDTGWDTIGIGWTSFFAGEGAAIHSTFWHNDFGTPRSHGCVNATPEDAKWVYRWTQPIVSYDPGDLTVEWPGGTEVNVIEG